MSPTDTQNVIQLGKYNVNLGQGQGDIHIGDRIYQGAIAEAIRDLIRSTLQELQSTATPIPLPLKSVDELVQEVRSRLHDDIQRLHGTMPLWGVDHWVPLGELFVDVNILEELSSSHRAELDALWQDFSKNPSYRSLDRIGLGRERERVAGLEVLERNTNLMVVGKPGSGKTTYLQRVVTECNSGNLQAHRIPVLIRLREFVDDGRSRSYCLERYLERCWQLSTPETQLVLSQGRSLVLLDGLDEVTGEDGKVIIKQIKQFSRTYPQVQMVVTCRTQGFSGEIDWKSLRFSFVEVADFNEPQVRSFVEHWFKTVMGDEPVGLAKAQELLEQLFRDENKPIRELAITPILLSLTCAVFHQAGKFYSKRSKLYEEGLELLLEQWDKSREIERDEIYRDLLVERKLELLSYLAVKKFEQEQYVLFEQEEIEGYIAEFLGIGQRESRSVLRAIESQHGLLVERARKIWSFSHLTFQEYLVAERTFTVLNLSNISLKELRRIAVKLSKQYWHEIESIIIEMNWDDDTLIRFQNKINNLVSTDPKIQNFLEWLENKLIANRSVYQPAGIRAFYFICSELLTIDFEFYLASIFDFGLGLEIDADLDRFLIGMIQCRITGSQQIEQTLRGLKFFLRIPNLGLRKIIKVFENELSTIVDDPNFPNSLTSDENISILEKIKQTAIESHKIGHSWRFEAFQLELLKEYYKLNTILALVCSKNGNISQQAKNTIQEMLLVSNKRINKLRR